MLSLNDQKLLVENTYIMDFLRSPQFTNHISTNPAIPSSTYPVDMQAAEKWINLHEEGTSQDCAQKIINNINHISFLQFLDALKIATNELNQHVKDNNLDPEQVVLVAPCVGRGHFSKSEPWVTSLALSYLDFKPKAIVDSMGLEEFRKKHLDVTTFVHFDDAAYSGTDMQAKMDYSKCDENVTRIAVVPFMSDFAKNKLSSDNIVVFRAEKMLAIPELEDLSEDEKQYLEKHNLSGSSTEYNSIKLSQLTLTYFDHKIADGLSVPEKLLTYGLPIESKVHTSDPMTMDMLFNPTSSDINDILSSEFSLSGASQVSGENLIRAQFIPEIIPCYKQLEPKRLQVLEECDDVVSISSSTFTPHQDAKVVDVAVSISQPNISKNEAKASGQTKEKPNL